jgi:hypothetical protein
MGWNAKGLAIMGAGVAKQAATRFPHLRRVWGLHAQQTVEVAGQRAAIAYDTFSRCFFLPTKYDWRDSSELGLIDEMTRHLAGFHAKLRSPSTPIPHLDNAIVALPLLGCGFGGLSREEVLPILEQHLDDHFTLVEL